jgi:hypothetical protein
MLDQYSGGSRAASDILLDKELRFHGAACAERPPHLVAFYFAPGVVVAGAPSTLFVRGICRNF